MKQQTTNKEYNIDELMLQYIRIKDDKKRRAIHLKVVQQGMDLVKRVAAPLAMQTTIPFEDLVQVGAMGLMKAIDAFSLNHHTKFTTYANYHIKGELRHYIRDKATIIKTPRKVQELLVKIYDASKKLVAAGKTEPTIGDIAKYIDVSPERVEEVMKVDKYKFMVSLDQTITSDEEDVTLLERLPATEYPDIQSTCETKILIENAINQLPSELKEILQLSFFEEFNQREIAEKLNMSQMQISRRLKKALSEMYDIIRRS